MRDEVADAVGATIAWEFGPPDLSRSLVARPDLVARINEAAGSARCTIVCAPAGYGKRTLVTQWARNSGTHVAWVEFRRGQDMPPLEDLIDRMAVMGDAFVVLDRPDRLPAEQRAHVGALIERAPRGVHFVVIARVNALFPATTARLLVRGDLVRFGADDLAFDRSSAQTLLEDALGRDVASDAIDTVVGHTAGWPAAIKFAAVAAQDARDPDAALACFDGGDLNFRAYCRPWLLDEQSEPVRGFLLATAVTDRFSTDLGEAITGRADTAQLTEGLERRGLVVADEHRPGWWRYRTPVRDALRADLRSTELGATNRVLHDAAAWHTQEGSGTDLEAAADYLIRARDWPAVLAHIQSHARTMHQLARVGTVLGWMLAVPESVRRADTATTLTEAALYTLTGETYRAANVLRALGDVDDLAPAERLAVQSIRQVWFFGHLSPADAIAATEDVERLLDETPAELTYSLGLLTRDQTRQNAGGVRAFAEMVRGRPAAARRALASTHIDGQPFALPSLWRTGILALIEAQYGSLSLALEHAAEARRIAEHAFSANHPFLMFAELAEAHVLIERDEHFGAQSALERASRSIGAFTFEVPPRWHALEQAHLALMAGASRDLLPVLDGEFTDADRLPLLDASRRVLTARLLYTLDDLEFARQQLRYDARTPFSDVAGAAVQLALASGDRDAAARIVASWPATTELQSELARELWTATVEFVSGAVEPACARASELLIRAREEGHVRMFRDAGLDVHRLLVAVSQRDSTPYVHALLRKHRSLGAPAGNGPALSPRERSVLACLADRMTYGEIAERLFISQNTVKTHAKSLYMKLGVGSRRGAIERADELGLL